MQLSKGVIKELKHIFKEDYKKELSDQEANEITHNLLGFFEVLYEAARKEAIREKKLKDHPKGFHLDDGLYNCIICYKQVTGEESWWDNLGPKCVTCQKTVERKVIPEYVCKNRDSWYAMWELKSKFGIYPATAKRMIREGKLKARIIKDEVGKDYFYIFLANENKKFLKENSNFKKKKDKYFFVTKRRF